MCVHVHACVCVCGRGCVVIVALSTITYFKLSCMYLKGRTYDNSLPTGNVIQHHTDNVNTFITYADLYVYTTLYRLLSAILGLLENHAADERAVLVACQAVPLCKDSFPKEVPAIAEELQRSAFSVFSQLAIRNNSTLMESVLQFTITLWTSYPTQLPSSCNLAQLASLVNTALDPDVHSNMQTAFRVGQDFVRHLMRVLSDKQLQELEMGGVYRRLRGLLSYYNDMSPEHLRQILVGVGMFAELKPSESYLDDGLHTSLLFAAEKYYSHAALQQLIWRLLALLCQQDEKFVRQLISTDVLSVIVTIMQKEGYQITPLLRFLTVCCHTVPNPFLQQCLEKQELMQLLLEMIRTDSPFHSLENVVNTCDFIAFLCSKCRGDAIQKIFELKLVTRLEECARKWPEPCLLPACIAIEGAVNFFPSDLSILPIPFTGALNSERTAFYAENHHLFWKEMLSNPLVSSNPALVELMYVTFQKLLKACTQDALAKMCEKDFLEFFVIAFIRDTIALPTLANRISFCSHYFVFQIKSKEAIECFKEQNFHTAIVDLIANTESYNVIVTTMGLLACLIGKYYDQLKDVKPLLETQLPEVLLEKVSKYGKMPRSQFGDDFSRIMLNITADKELSLELYNKGYMDHLVTHLHDDYIPTVKRTLIHAVGNIALGGQHIKQVLLDRETYKLLLTILEEQLEKGDPYLLSACCRVLHILASGDWAKRKFVEHGCVDLLVKLMKRRKDNPELCWRPLGLLSSIGFMAVVNRRYILTRDVVETVITILKESTNGKVISYTSLVFLASGELDEGSTRLKELGIEAPLRKAIENPEFRKQGVELERWGIHVLEKQALHTVFVPRHTIPSPPPSSRFTIDWPPLLDSDSPMDVEGVHTSSPNSLVHNRKLLPLEDAYLKTHTPIAPVISETAKEQLTKLGLNPNEPLFRIGRVYGSTHGLCSNCEKDGGSEELVIRPQSMTPFQYQLLINNGWYRRGGVKMFRLRCNHNVHCCDWETRVSVKDFDYRTHKSYKKVLRKMPLDRLTIETKPTHFDREAFDLYNEYHVTRHDKPRKSEYSYCEHVVNTPIANQTVDGFDYGTYHQLYKLDGKLVAIGIIDIVPTGIVSIYMWYSVSKEVLKLSFGVYSALKEIEFVRELSQRNPNMKYYYLQGWNENNKKLSYKANYSPEEFYCPCVAQGWIQNLDQVTSSKQQYIQKKQEEEAESMVPDESKSLNPSDNPPSSSGGTIEEDQGKETAEEKETDASSTSQNKKPNSTAAPKHTQMVSEKNKDEEKKDKDDKSPSEPAIYCEAFPIDKARYQQQTGQRVVDVNKLVICLNYSEYMYLGQLFERFRPCTEQQSVMEQRFAELLVALGPELCSQLVVDLKACPSSEEVSPSQERMQEV